MSTHNAFNDLEDQKSIGYENDLKPSEDFYCKICKIRFEFDDVMIELDHATTNTGNTVTWVGTCERCYV